MRIARAVLILMLALKAAQAHRLDEYLQASLLSLRKTGDTTELRGQMTLTPGVNVFPLVIAGIDTDSDGVISEAESRVYAAAVLGDLSLRLDDAPLQPELIEARFPAVNEMKEGRGEIRIGFRAQLPAGRVSRHRLVMENHHQSRIAAYEVNSLVPADLAIRIEAQNRDYTQSRYELYYEQKGLPATAAPGWQGWLITLSPLGLLLVTWLTARALKTGGGGWLPRGEMFPR